MQGVIEANLSPVLMRHPVRGKSPDAPPLWNEMIDWGPASLWVVSPDRRVRVPLSLVEPKGNEVISPAQLEARIREIFAAYDRSFVEPG